MSAPAPSLKKTGRILGIRYDEVDIIDGKQYYLETINGKNWEPEASIDPELLSKFNKTVKENKADLIKDSLEWLSTQEDSSVAIIIDNDHFKSSLGDSFGSVTDFVFSDQKHLRAVVTHVVKDPNGGLSTFEHYEDPTVIVPTVVDTVLCVSDVCYIGDNSSLDAYFGFLDFFTNDRMKKGSIALIGLIDPQKSNKQSASEWLDDVLIPGLIKEVADSGFSLTVDSFLIDQETGYHSLFCHVVQLDESDSESESESESDIQEEEENEDMPDGESTPA